MAHIPQPLEFTFPTNTPHAGIPFGNGNFGVLAWGEGDAFNLTLNRQDYWSLPWAAKLWLRMGEPQAAKFCLEQCGCLFMHGNGFGTHNAFKRGFTSWICPDPPYIMQMDITAGLASAVMEWAQASGGQRTGNPTAAG